ncbi:MAG: hypothetical protein CVT90_00960 [Candidatus Altiarchaeales archaeon HGW-Altiarchaeales-3]|nr:MAG: hypothetical protein CVT90_00960 [Candidatus Altiarchaeales archaeon HGW-Altiarchaeales-3]
MKQQLNSVDIYILTRELNNLNKIRNIRVDKTYQIAEKELKIKINITNQGSKDLILAPNYLCVSEYPRPAPTKASSFAMQLRKHLKGGFIREIGQHDFDRIVEIVIEKKEVKFILIAEFFSRGNVILCDENKKIMGLLEWQKWKDRKLGVNQIYEYPPKPAGVLNPLNVSQTNFYEILTDPKIADKKLASILAMELGIGGFYAEEICGISGLDKSKSADELNDDEINVLFNNFNEFIEKLKNMETEPQVALKSGDAEDVIPYKSETYAAPVFETKNYESFNAAVDEYFSKSESERFSSEIDKKFLDKLKKLENRKKSQEEVIEKLKKKSEDYKEYGELIYKNFRIVEKIRTIIHNAQKQGFNDKEIMKKIKDAQKAGMKEAEYIKNLRHTELEIEIEG